jgi:hypothetical protein
MSGSGQKRLLIACALLLMCGVIVALLVRRPVGLTLTLLSYETNNLNGVMANILVSNGVTALA